jgi:hypothetical protein
LSYTTAASGTSRTAFFSSRISSALALMLALSSPDGFSIETLTSKVVTFSFSTPMGEILVTRPSNFRSLNASTVMRAICPLHTLPMSASSTLPCT